MTIDLQVKRFDEYDFPVNMQSH